MTDREWDERRPVAYSRLPGKTENHRGVATAVATLWALEPVLEGTYVLDNYEYQTKCRRTDDWLWPLSIYAVQRGYFPFFTFTFSSFFTVTNIANLMRGYCLFAHLGS